MPVPGSAFAVPVLAEQVLEFVQAAEQVFELVFVPVLAVRVPVLAAALVAVPVVPVPDLAQEKGKEKAPKPFCWGHGYRPPLNFCQTGILYFYL